MEQPRLAHIDALKGIGIVYIVLFHAVNLSPGTYPSFLYNLFASGWSGIQLFYMVSAYSLWRTFAQREASASHSILAFYIRRFFRIAPLYYVVLIWYIVLYGFSSPSWGFTATLFTLTNGFFPAWDAGTINGGWAVTTGVVFYILAPLFFVFIKNLPAAVGFLLGSLVVYHGQNYILGGMVAPELLTFYFLSQAPYFFLGVVMYYILHGAPAAEPRKEAKAGKSTVYLVLSGLAILILAITNDKSYNQFLLVVLLLAFGVALARAPHRYLVNRFTIFVGRLSYSAYLIHFAVLVMLAPYYDAMIAKNGILLNLAYGVAVFVITIIISELTFVAIEEPGRKLGSICAKYVA